MMACCGGSAQLSIPKGRAHLNILQLEEGNDLIDVLLLLFASNGSRLSKDGAEEQGFADGGRNLVDVGLLAEPATRQPVTLLPTSFVAPDLAGERRRELLAIDKNISSNDAAALTLA